MKDEGEDSYKAKIYTCFLIYHSHIKSQLLYLKASVVPLSKSIFYAIISLYPMQRLSE